MLSLANAPNVRSAEGDLNVAPLYEEPPRDAAELARIRHDLLDNPLLRGTLISEDETTTALVIPLLDMPEQAFTRVEPTDWLPGWLVRAIGARERDLSQQGIDKQIKQIAAQELGEGVQYWLVGGAHIKAETTRYLLRDLMLVIPLAFLLIVVVAAGSFRSVRGVLIPVATITISVVWTIAVMAMLEPALNLVTVGVPSLLLVIGFAYGVHIVASYNDAIEEGGGHAGSAAQRGLEAVLLPDLPDRWQHRGGLPVARHESARRNPRVRHLRRARRRLRGARRHHLRARRAPAAARAGAGEAGATRRRATRRGASTASSSGSAPSTAGTPPASSPRSSCSSCSAWPAFRASS